MSTGKEATATNTFHIQINRSRAEAFRAFNVIGKATSRVLRTRQVGRRTGTLFFSNRVTFIRLVVGNRAVLRTTTATANSVRTWFRVQIVFIDSRTFGFINYYINGLRQRYCIVARVLLRAASTVKRVLARWWSPLSGALMFHSDVLTN